MITGMTSAVAPLDSGSPSLVIGVEGVRRLLYVLATTGACISTLTGFGKSVLPRFDRALPVLGSGWGADRARLLGRTNP
ncbi:MAG: hypothetical protein HOY78_17115 [Saccharothrix sp.]|nr:hypothetical protein [Saccharothrix sp.]